MSRQRSSRTPALSSYADDSHGVTPKGDGCPRSGVRARTGAARPCARDGWRARTLGAPPPTTPVQNDFTCVECNPTLNTASHNSDSTRSCRECGTVSVRTTSGEWVPVPDAANNTHAGLYRTKKCRRMLEEGVCNKQDCWFVRSRALARPSARPDPRIGLWQPRPARADAPAHEPKATARQSRQPLPDVRCNISLACQSLPLTITRQVAVATATDTHR
jgi:hypothetical protein